MKGNDKLIATLNSLVADELTAINQYIVHSEMANNHGYTRLHDAIFKRALTEMQHVERLIERILFLEGKPIVSRLKDITIGIDVEKQFINDHAKEEEAVAAYNAAIKQARDLGDNSTAELLEDILEDEIEHIDDIEARQAQIEQLGIQLFLASQIEQSPPAR